MKLNKSLYSTVYGPLNSRNTGWIYNWVNWEEQKILKSGMSKRNVVPSCLSYSYKSWLKCLKQPEKPITLRSWFSGISSCERLCRKVAKSVLFCYSICFPTHSLLSEMTELTRAKSIGYIKLHRRIKLFIWHPFFDLKFISPTAFQQTMTPWLCLFIPF